MKKLSKKTYFLAAVLSSLVFGSSLDVLAEETPSGVKAESKAVALKTETDFDKAYDAAKKDGKKVMLEFAGLNWCPPCKMMHKFVVNTEEFAKYANDNLHVVMADFERSGEPVNKKSAKRFLELSQKYNLRYFPTIVLINPKTDKVKIIEGLQTKSPSELIEVIETFDK